MEAKTTPFHTEDFSPFVHPWKLEKSNKSSRLELNSKAPGWGSTGVCWLVFTVGDVRGIVMDQWMIFWYLLIFYDWNPKCSWNKMVNGPIDILDIFPMDDLLISHWLPFFAWSSWNVSTATSIQALVSMKTWLRNTDYTQENSDDKKPTIWKISTINADFPASHVSFCVFLGGARGTDLKQFPGSRRWRTVGPVPRLQKLIELTGAICWSILETLELQGGQQELMIVQFFLIFHIMFWSSIGFELIWVQCITVGRPDCHLKC